MKKLLSLLLCICIAVSVLAVTAMAAETVCAPDQHSFDLTTGVCSKCSLQATVVEPGSGTLKTAVTDAGKADANKVLVLKAGEYKISGELAIKSGHKGLLIVGQGDGEGGTYIKQESSGNHIFHVGDIGNDTEVTLVNLKLDRAGMAKCGVAVKYSSVVNLYHVTVTGSGKNGWRLIQIDNGYSSNFGNHPENDGAISVINAYDVYLDGDTIVNIGACSDTYAKINYDSNCNISAVVMDYRSGDTTAGFNNFLVNTVPVESAVASVTYNGTTIGYTSFADALAVVNEPKFPTGDYTVTLLKDSAETVTVKQRVGTNVTITAANKNVAFKGTITIDGCGSSNKDNQETLTITGMTFDGSLYSGDGAYQAITIPNKGSAGNGAHNILIENCKFVDDDHSMTAFWARQSKNVTMRNCTQTGGFQLFWIGSSDNVIKVENVTSTGVIEGVNTIDSTSISVINANIEASSHAVRLSTKGTGSNEIINCTLKAPIPVWTREGSSNPVTISDSALIATIGTPKHPVNADNVYEDGISNSYILSDVNNIKENDYAAKIGDTYYATFAAAIAVVSDGETIVLLNDNAETEIVVEREVFFFIDANGFAYDANEIKPEKNYVCTASGSPFDDDLAVFDFVYVAPPVPVANSQPIFIVNSDGGSVSTYLTSAVPGEVVYCNVTPDYGYELAYIEIMCNGIPLEVWREFNGYSFIMPDGAVTIAPHFERVLAANTYSDVIGGTYYYDAVRWGLSRGILMNQTGKFNPDAACTRASIIEQIWRAAGCPLAYGTVQFTDVSADASYAQAVQWAVEQGITTGRTASTFDPNAVVTRAEAMTFLWRYAGCPQLGVGSFEDVKADSYYAYAVNWAVVARITNGTSMIEFSPVADCTNAHIITFLYRWFAK